MRFFALLLVCLFALPAGATELFGTAKGKAHCNLDTPISADFYLSLPNEDFGCDGTIQLGDLTIGDACYDRRGEHFAIAGWGKSLSRIYPFVSIVGEAKKNGRLKGSFHLQLWGAQCSASGKLR